MKENRRISGFILATVCIALVSVGNEEFAGHGSRASASPTPQQSMTPNDPEYGKQWYLSKIDVENAWRETTGSPDIVVAVLDSGVDADHEDLKDILLPGWDCVDNDDSPDDLLGHGTGTVGIVAGNRNNGKGLAGIAPGCKIIPIKVANDIGEATPDDVVEGIDLAITRGARIICIGVASVVWTDSLKSAVERARENGALIVAPAGNGGSNALAYPAGFKDVISVTATNGDDLPVDGVNMARGTTVAAPGTSILSTYPIDRYGGVAYTSSATAIVTGVCALLLSKEPNLSNEQICAILKNSSTPLSVAAFSDFFGFGIVNAGRAIQMADLNYSDIAVVSIDILPTSPMAGREAKIVAGIANMGNRKLKDIKVNIYINNVLITPKGKNIGGVGIGEKEEAKIEWDVPKVAGAYTIRVEIAPLPGDGNIANNAMEKIVNAVNQPLHNIAVGNIEMHGGKFDMTTYKFKIEVENLGNVEERNIVVKGTVRDVPVVDKTIEKLKPGERKRVEFPYTDVEDTRDAQRVLRVHAESVVGEEEESDNEMTFNFYYRPTGAMFQTQYVDMYGQDIVVDAPWRVKPGMDYVPVMIFFPNIDWEKLFLFDMDIYARESGDWGLVYFDDMYRNANNDYPHVKVVNELGNELDNKDFITGNPISNSQDGFHRILRIPKASFTTTGYGTQYLWTRLRFDKTYMKASCRASYTFTRNLRVTLSKDDLPHFQDAPIGSYFDSHYHTITEWSRSNAVLAPRQAFGGPIQMLTECAYALGFTDKADYWESKDKITTTDHNTFFVEKGSQYPYVEVERPNVGPTADKSRTEWDILREIFGKGAGEEIAINRDPTAAPPSIGAAHMLGYQGPHIDGPWHGGLPAEDVHVGAKIVKYAEPNFNVIDNVIRRYIEVDKSYTYAAHPLAGLGFTQTGWSEDNIDRALALSPYNTVDRTRATGEEAGFAFKGLQLWNERNTMSRGGLSQDEFFYLNPYDPSAGGWLEDANYDAQLRAGIDLWHKKISQGLAYAIQGQNEKFFRKVYLLGGTDAHGDFNYKTGTTATAFNTMDKIFEYILSPEVRALIRKEVISGNVISDNAMGKIRVYTFDNDIEKMKYGKCVATDGPIMEYYTDADDRFDSARHRWSSGRNMKDDKDGEVGGSGSFDGGGTMLVRKEKDGGVHRYRWSTTDEFGQGVVTIKSAKIELDAAGQPVTVSQNLALGDKEMWTASPMDPVQNSLAFSLAGYTPFEGRNTDQQYRCYTNPIWVAPVETTIRETIVVENNGDGGLVIPPGGLEFTFAFPISMENKETAVFVKFLSAEGESVDTLIHVMKSNGWTSNGGVSNNIYKATNCEPIPLFVSEGEVYMVVYMTGKEGMTEVEFAEWKRCFESAPAGAKGYGIADCHKNQLNPIAQPFVVRLFAGTGSGALIDDLPTELPSTSFEHTWDFWFGGKQKVVVKALNTADTTAYYAGLGKPGVNGKNAYIYEVSDLSTGEEWWFQWWWWGAWDEMTARMYTSGILDFEISNPYAVVATDMFAKIGNTVDPFDWVKVGSGSYLRWYATQYVRTTKQGVFGFTVPANIFRPGAYAGNWAKWWHYWHGEGASWYGNMSATLIFTGWLSGGLTGPAPTSTATTQPPVAPISTR